MGFVPEFLCPTSYYEISNNPHDPNWDLDCLVSEMDSVVKNLNVFSKNGRGFVMRVSEEDETESEEENCQICTACDDDDDDLYPVINDHKSQTAEDIKNRVSVVEAEILHESATFRSAIARVEKYRETREHVERRLDCQYRRNVAETLDTNLTQVRQRAHEENTRAEAVMKATIRVEKEAKKESGQRKAAKKEKRNVAKTWTQAEYIASRLEKLRLKKLRELEATNQWLKSLSKRDWSSFEKNIARVIKQIRGTKDNVTAKTNEILKRFKDPSCHVSISIAAFAKEMASARGNPFAFSYVIVHVTSQYPQVMDILLAEIHKTCIYTTVPEQNTVNSSDQSGSDSEANYKSIDSVMRLYGALIQTDIHGNTHGIEHGWTWLVRFLNLTTAHNRATATALNAFLQTAGFGLHQKYKYQFLKAVRVVNKHFLPKLKAEKDESSDLKVIIAEITAYIDDQMYLNEPQGRTMSTNILSR